MTLFAFTAMPLLFLLVVSYYFSGYAEGKATMYPFLRGGLVLLPSLLLGFVIRILAVENFTFPGAYAYGFFFDTFLFPMLAMAGYYILAGIPGGDESERLMPLVGFFAGYFSFLTLGEWMLNFREFDGYASFLLPLVRMVFVLAVPLLVLTASAERGTMRVVWFAGASLLPFLTAFVPFFAYTYRPVIASVLAVLFLASVGTAFHFLHRRI